MRVPEPSGSTAMVQIVLSLWSPRDGTVCHELERLGEEIDEITLDLLWGIFSHEVYGILVLDHGLDGAHYAAHVDATVTALTSAA